jgi:hypothetical protein
MFLIELMSSTPASLDFVTFVSNRRSQKLQRYFVPDRVWQYQSTFTGSHAFSELNPLDVTLPQSSDLGKWTKP